MSPIAGVFSFLSRHNIDTALGVGAGTLFFAKVYGQSLDAWTLLWLMGVTWVAYSLDRLLDNWQFQDFRHFSRHVWHRDSQGRILLVLAVLCAVLLWVLLSRLPLYFAYRLSALGFIFFLHHLALRYFSYRGWKEGVVAAVYTAMIAWLPYETLKPSLPIWAMIAVYFLLVLMNVLIYAGIECQDRQESARASIADWGVARIYRLCDLVSVLAITLITVASLYSMELSRAWVILWLMALLHTIWYRRLRTDSQRGSYPQGLRYRWLGESLFYIPIASLWI